MTDQKSETEKTGTEDPQYSDCGSPVHFYMIGNCVLSYKNTPQGYKAPVTVEVLNCHHF